MTIAASLAQIALIGCLLALLLVVVRAMARQHVLRGLLCAPNTGEFQPERLVVLLVTIASAIGYLLAVLVTAATDLPDPGPELLSIFGGTSAAYLLRKVLRLYRLQGEKER